MYPSFVAIDTYIDGGTPYRRKNPDPAIGNPWQTLFALL